MDRVWEMSTNEAYEEAIDKIHTQIECVENLCGMEEEDLLKHMASIESHVADLETRCNHYLKVIAELEKNGRREGLQAAIQELDLTIEQAPFFIKDPEATLELCKWLKSNIQRLLEGDLLPVTDMIPPDLYATISKFFSGDDAKTRLWFNTANPMLGQWSPMRMIEAGRVEKLRQFVGDAMRENGGGEK